MLSLGKIMQLLMDRRLDVVSRETGVNRNTLADIRDGKNRNPTYRTLAKLSNYFAGQTDE